MCLKGKLAENWYEILFNVNKKKIYDTAAFSPSYGRISPCKATHALKIAYVCCRLHEVIYLFSLWQQTLGRLAGY